MASLKSRLQRGDSLLGCWSVLGSPHLCEIFGLAGFDFIILDFEHGVLTAENLERCLVACRSAGARAIVRPPSLSSETVQMALDLGADGLLFPQVQNASDVSQAFAATYFAPQGRRGYNPFTRASDFGLAPILARPDELLRCVILESQSAWDDLDRLLQVEGLDMVYLGVYDMSVALGCPGEVNHVRVLSFVDQAITRIHAAGKAVGLMVHRKEDLDLYKSKGVQTLVYSLDTHLISGLARRCKEQFDESR